MHLIRCLIKNNFGVPARNRTGNLCLRRALRYPITLRKQIFFKYSIVFLEMQEFECCVLVD